MKNQFLLDTDILIDYLRNEDRAISFVEKAIKNVCFISAMSVSELYVGVREGKERYLLEQFFSAFEIININHDIAKIGGLYRRDYGKSHGVGLVDALIAAAVDSCGAQLATLNKKHYPMLKHVLVPYRKTDKNF